MNLLELISTYWSILQKEGFNSADNFLDGSIANSEIKKAIRDAFLTPSGLMLRHLKIEYY